jgi:hypothetical protein
MTKEALTCRLIINDKELLSFTVARLQQTRHQIPAAVESVCRFAIVPFNLFSRSTQQQVGKRILRFTKCKTHHGFRQTFFFIFFKIFCFFSPPGRFAPRSVAALRTYRPLRPVRVAAP